MRVQLFMLPFLFPATFSVRSRRNVEFKMSEKLFTALRKNLREQAFGRDIQF